MALYQNGILISGANKLPQMTYAAWQALPAVERPSEWICTDRSYSDLPASDVTYDNTDSGLSADNIQDAIDEVAQSGGSGGHVIQDASGTDMTQRANMQFTDSHVSDDSTNDKTVIENIKSVASADYSLETEDGLYLIPDGDGSVIEPASEDYVEVTADGVKTYGTLLSELFVLTDTSKITKDTKLKIGSFVLDIDDIDAGTTTYRFERINSLTTSYAVIEQLGFRNSPYYRTVTLQTSGITLSDTLINGVPSDGTKLTLYYGNKKAVVDLQTTANRCLRPNGNTVEQSIKNLEIDATTYGTSTNYVEDFNSITQTGEYWCSIKLNITLNAPTNYNGILRVINVGDGIIQVYIDRTNANMFTRSYRTSWSAWRMVTQNTI